MHFQGSGATQRTIKGNQWYCILTGRAREEAFSTSCKLLRLFRGVRHRALNTRQRFRDQLGRNLAHRDSRESLHTLVFLYNMLYNEG